MHVTANGKPVACKIHMQMWFGGSPVGEVGTHVVKNGVWKETIVAKGPNASRRARSASRSCCTRP